MNVNPSDANTHPDYRSVLKVLDAKRQGDDGWTMS
jgi:hypothetical protein